MSREVEQFANEFIGLLRPLVRAVVMEELEPFRALLLQPVGEALPAVGELVDAIEIAKLMGEDLSTEKSKRAALQKVYDLARRNLIPSVRVSPRRIKFDLQAVKTVLAQGGQAKPYTVKTGKAVGAANSLRS